MKISIAIIYIITLLTTWGCGSDDCEESPISAIIFRPYFASDSLHVWDDFGSRYRFVDIEVTHSSGDSLAYQAIVEGGQITIYTNFELLAEDIVAAAVDIKDSSQDTIITTINFSTTLKDNGGGDCSVAIAEEVILRQGDIVLYSGQTSPSPKIYFLN